MNNPYESARKAVQWGFFLLGIPVGALVPRLAEIKIAIGASDAGYGSAVALGGFGVIVGNYVGSRMAHRYGTRTTARIIFVLVMVSNLANAFAPNVPWFTVVALTGGFAYSAITVAVNSQGSLVEQGLGRSFMPRAHAFWSIGTMFTAMVSSLVAPYVTPRQTLLAAFVVALVAYQFLATDMLAREYEDHPHGDASQLQRDERIPSRLFRFIVLLAFANWLGLFAEISVGDWSSVLLKEHLDIPVGPNGYAFSVFMVFQTLGRFNAPRFVDRRSLAFVVRTFALIGGTGFLVFLAIAVAVHEESQLAALLSSCTAYGFLGLGVSVMPPAWASAVAGIRGLPTVRALALLGTITALMNVAARLLFAQFAELVSLPWALPLTGLVVIAAAFMTFTLHPERLEQHAITKESA